MINLSKIIHTFPFDTLQYLFQPFFHIIRIFRNSYPNLLSCSFNFFISYNWFSKTKKKKKLQKKIFNTRILSSFTIDESKFNSQSSASHNNKLISLLSNVYQPLFIYETRTSWSDPRPLKPWYLMTCNG